MNEYFLSDNFFPEQMDYLLSVGWRHFGNYFFRYSTLEQDGAALHVMPLRIDLKHFQLSRSQKRILKRNQDLKIEINPASITPEKEALFHKHKTRFTEYVPESLPQFLGENPAEVPCRTFEITLFLEDTLLAASFLDLGSNSTSSIYSIFNPDEKKRSLGIYLILLSIQFSKESGFEYYYPGYVYEEPSAYDYKKRFAGLEYYDWENWKLLQTRLQQKSHTSF